MNELTTIELSSLSTVSGGQQTPIPAGPSSSRSGIFENGAGGIRRRVAAKLKVNTPAVQAEGDGVYESTDNNYSTCMTNTLPGTPERLKCFDSPATTGGQ